MTTAAKMVHLQYVGDVPGVEASELSAGDRLMWNFGMVSTVVSVEDASPKFIRIVERAKDGQDYTRRLKKDRLVARVGQDVQSF